MSSNDILNKHITLSLDVKRDFDLRGYLNEGASRRNMPLSMYILMAFKNQLDKDGIYVDFEDNYRRNADKEKFRANLYGYGNQNKIPWEEE